MIDLNGIVFPHRSRQLLALAFFTLTLLTACAERSALTIEEKTRFVSELIAERVECNDYWLKLSTPAKDDNTLNALYESAKAAHCLKPDV